MSHTMQISRSTRLALITAGALAAFQVGAHTAGQQQTVEVVRAVGPDATAILGGGGISVMAPVMQTGTGVLVGQVVDADTLTPVPGALVAIGGPTAGAMRLAGGGMMFGGPAGGGGRGAGGAEPVPQVLTDSSGRFAFRNLPSGSFNINAEKAGYLDGSYGRLRPEGSSIAVRMEDDERRSDITVRMFRPATITGRLVDSRNEPVVGADVRVYRREMVSGRRMLNAEGRPATTDDRGVYRVPGLVPGEYVVVAPTLIQSAPASLGMTNGMGPDLMATMMTPGNGSFSYSSSGGTPVGDGRFVVQPTGRSTGGGAPEADGRILSFPTTYFPSASSASEAAAVTVGSGEVRSDVDIALALQPTTTISGRLMGPEGPAVNYALHLVPSDTGGLSADPDVATAITDQDGSFMFVGVPAGNYVVQTVRSPSAFPRGDGNFTMIQAGGGGATMAFSARVETGRGGGGAARMERAPDPEPEPTLWTAMPISTDGTPVNGVALSLREGFAITGRIVFEGAAERPTPDQMRRISIVADPVDGRRSAGPTNSQVTEEGQFESSGLLPGRYVVRAANAGQNWSLKSVALGGRDISESPLDVQRAVEGVVITFTDTPSSLSGTVRNSDGQPDDEAAVLIFPADNQLWQDYGTNPRRMRILRTTETGNYSARALPAGDYHVVAIREEFAGEWEDPRVLEQVALLATRMTVGEAGQFSQDLTTQPFQGIRRAPAPAPEAFIPAPAPSSARPYLGEPEYAPLSDGHGPFVPEPSPQQARDARAMPTAGTSSLSGTVVLDDASGMPVRRARVSLRNAESRVDYAVMTDDSGRFSLSGLPSGRYSLTATKPAHVTAYYGSRRPGRGPGVPVALTEGSAIDDVVMRMAPGGVLAGRVTDEFGQPVPDANVRVTRRQARPDGPALLAGFGLRSSTQTDDRGEYRAYGLTPGDYTVTVTPPRQSRSEMRQLTTADVDNALADANRPGSGPADLGGHTVGYAPVYYPGTTSASGATAVSVASGRVLENVDIPIRRVPTARIEGRITGPDGQPVAGVSALLLPEEDAPTLSVNISSIVRTGPDGTFTVTNVVPGRYRLSARSNGGRAGNQVVELGGGGVFIAERTWSRSEASADTPPDADPGKPLWAEAMIDVNGQDIIGLSLTMQEGMTISGRVAFDGDRPAPEDMTSIRVNITPTARDSISLGVPGTRVNEDGTFTIEGVTPGSFQLAANVPASGFTPDSAWQMASAVSGGRDTLDSSLNLLPGQPVNDVVITFTDRQTEVTGTVLDPANAPVSDLTILMLPADPAHWSAGSRRMPQPQQPDSNGQFRFSGLPPGDYLLAAVIEVEDGDWGNPAYMEQVAAAGIPLRLADGEAKVQDLRIGGGQ